MDTSNRRKATQASKLSNFGGFGGNTGFGGGTFDSVQFHQRNGAFQDDSKSFVPTEDDGTRKTRRISNFGFPANPMESVKRASTLVNPMEHVKRASRIIQPKTLSRAFKEGSSRTVETMKVASNFVAEDLVPNISKKAIKRALDKTPLNMMGKKNRRGAQSNFSEPAFDIDEDDFEEEESFNANMIMDEDEEEESSERYEDEDDDFFLPIQSERNERMERSNLRSRVNSIAQNSPSRKVLPVRKAPPRFDSFQPTSNMHRPNRKTKPAGNMHDSMMGFGAWEGGPVNLAGGMEAFEEEQTEGNDDESEGKNLDTILDTEHDDDDDDYNDDEAEEVNSRGSINIFNFGSESDDSSTPGPVDGAMAEGINSFQGSDFFGQDSFTSHAESIASEASASNMTKPMADDSEGIPATSELSHIPEDEDYDPIEDDPTKQTGPELVPLSTKDGSLSKLRRVGGTHRRVASGGSGDDYTLSTFRSEALRNAYDVEANLNDGYPESDSESDEENKGRWKRMKTLSQKTKMSQEIARASIIPFEPRGRKPKVLANRKSIIEWRKEMRAARRNRQRETEDNFEPVFLKNMRNQGNVGESFRRKGSLGQSLRSLGGRQQSQHTLKGDEQNEDIEDYCHNLAEDEEWQDDMEGMFATKPEEHRKKHSSRASF